MKANEKEALLKAVYAHIEKNGMPINIRDGANEIVAEWVANQVAKQIGADEPTGTEVLESGGKYYDACPICHRVVGTSGKYCKWCGQLIRK